MNTLQFGQQSVQPQAARFSRDLTSMDLSDDLGPVQSKGGYYVQFFYVRVRIETADATLNGTFQTRLCIAKAPIGDRLTVSTREIDELTASREHPREFAAFKQYEDVPTNGTPLHELPGVSQSQIAILVLNNLRSIEDVANLQPEQITGMGMDALQAHKLAKRWLDAKVGAVDLIGAAERDAQTSAEMADLKRRAEASEKQNAMLQAQVQALMQMSGNANAATMAGQPVAVEGEKLPDIVETPLFEGGMVSGNDDLNAAEDPDPIGIRAGKKG